MRPYPTCAWRTLRVIDAGGGIRSGRLGSVRPAHDWLGSVRFAHDPGMSTVPHPMCARRTLRGFGFSWLGSVRFAHDRA